MPDRIISDKILPDKIVDLKLPLSPREARELELGTRVTVSGMIFTGRSRFHIRAVEENLVPPLDYKRINCFFHAGPVMAREENEWRIVSIEPTSSIRFERYSPEVIRKLDLHVLIGKTTMGRGTAEALQEVGGVHLTKIGICGNQIRERVKKVHGVHFLDELGKTEATWVLEVERFGPFFVDIDARGNNYFQNLEQRIGDNLDAVYAQLGVPPGYDFTHVQAEREGEGE